MRIILAIIVTILLMQPAPAVYYVAPYGTTAGDGSADSPRTLAWALASAPSGSTVWLIPGTYAGSFTANASGVSYRSVPGTRARLDGSLSIIAADTSWRDLEITHTDWPNRSAGNGSTLYIYGARTKVLNSWIHDLSDGVGFWKPAVGAELSGNLIYNNGYGTTSHSLYAQNQDGTKLIRHNIIGTAYGGYAVHVYSSAGADAVKGFTLDHNVVWGSNFLIGGNSRAERIRVERNILYGMTMQLGYTAVNSDVVVLGNTVIAPSYALSFNRWAAATIRGNTFISTGGNFIVDRIDSSPHTYDWDANSWRYGGTYSQPFGYPSFAAWQGSGVDASSTYTPTLPTQDVVSVWPTTPHHGIVSVQHWTQAQTVTLDLAPLALTSGAAYRLINAQNPAERHTFTAGSPVVIAMAGWSVAVPYGAVAPIKAWDSRFAVFVVEPAS